MLKDLDPKEMGFTVIGMIAPNGSKRCRLIAPNGTLYSNSETSIGKEKWDNSHHHGGLNEVYVVEIGWIALARCDGGKFTVSIYRSGGVVSLKPGSDHNVLKSSGGVTHVLKFGKPVGNPEKDGNDWFPSNDKFDSWSKGLTIKDIEEITGESL